MAEPTEPVNARRQIAGLLKQLLPADWVVLHYRPTSSNLGKPNVWVQQSTVRRAPAAPAGIDETSLTVTLAEPTISPDSADDRLEANLDILLDAIDRLTGVTRGESNRGVTAPENGFPGYDTDLTLTTSRKAI